MSGSGMKASEKLEERNKFFGQLAAADRGLRKELAKPAGDPSKRSAAVVERAMSKREYIGKKIKSLGGEPWPFNPDHADNDYVGSVSDAENQEHRGGVVPGEGQPGGVEDHVSGGGSGSGWGGDDGPAAV